MVRSFFFAYTCNSSEYSDFHSFWTNFSFLQYITEPTRITDKTANLLDLILNPDFSLVSSITYLHGISNHDSLNINFHTSLCISTRYTKKILNNCKANVDAITCELARFLDQCLPAFPERLVETNWNMSENKVNALITSFIPCRNITYNHLSPRFNVTLKLLSNKKKCIFHLEKSSAVTERWELYKSAANAYQTAIKKRKLSYFNVTFLSRLSNSTIEAILECCERPQKLSYHSLGLM